MSPETLILGTNHSFDQLTFFVGLAVGCLEVGRLVGFSPFRTLTVCSAVGLDVSVSGAVGIIGLVKGGESVDGFRKGRI